MSNIEAMVWATEVRRDTMGFFPNPTAKYVAAALARRCWATGRVCWSQGGLARDTGMSPRSIWTALQALEGAGMLKREKVIINNLRRSDRLIFTLRAVTIALEPDDGRGGDFDETGLAIFAEQGDAAASQNLRGEPLAKSATPKPRTTRKKKDADASSSSRGAAPPPKRNTVPEDWEIKDAHREKVIAFAWPDGMLDEQADRFREWEFRDPKTNFDLAFHRWLRQENDRLKGRGNEYGSQPGNAGAPPRRGSTPREERLGALQRGAMAALDRRGRPMG